MPILSLEQYSDQERRALARIKELVASTEQRTEALFKSFRRHERKAFEGGVLICLPTAEAPDVGEDHPSTFQAWAYNVSQGGIGFVAPRRILDNHLAVGLRLPNGRVRWMRGRIVRMRPIPNEDFFDYGVAFEGADAAKPPS
jgi:hypothetical protein